MKSALYRPVTPIALSLRHGVLSREATCLHKPFTQEEPLLQVRELWIGKGFVGPKKHMASAARFQLLPENVDHSPNILGARRFLGNRSL